MRDPGLRPEYAVREFDEVLTRLPNDTLTLEESAKALAMVGRLDEARERLKRALEIEPNNSRCRELLERVQEQLWK